MKYIDIKTWSPPLSDQLSLRVNSFVSTYWLEIWSIKWIKVAWCIRTVALEDGRCKKEVDGNDLNGGESQQLFYASDPASGHRGGNKNQGWNWKADSFLKAATLGPPLNGSAVPQKLALIYDCLKRYTLAFHVCSWKHSPATASLPLVCPEAS